MEIEVEIVDYYACILLGKNEISLIYQTERAVSDHWRTKQGEISYFLNGVSVSRSSLPDSITAEIIAELVATASIVERRSDWKVV